MTTHQLLQLLPEGRADARMFEHVLAELGSEFGHRELTSLELEERDDWTIRPPHADSIRFYRKNPGATFHDYLRHAYRDDAIAGISMQSHPLLRMVPR